MSEAAADGGQRPSWDDMLEQAWLGTEPPPMSLPPPAVAEPAPAPSAPEPAPIAPEPAPAPAQPSAPAPAQPSAPSAHPDDPSASAASIFASCKRLVGVVEARIRMLESEFKREKDVVSRFEALMEQGFARFDGHVSDLQNQVRTIRSRNDETRRGLDHVRSWIAAHDPDEPQPGAFGRVRKDHQSAPPPRGRGQIKNGHDTSSFYVRSVHAYDSQQDDSPYDQGDGYSRRRRAGRGRG